MTSSAPDLSILVPVYNERDTVARALEGLLDARAGGMSTELVVVDDGSTDGTGAVLAGEPWASHPRVRTMAHPRNRGKGAAVRTALEQARGRYTTIMDADLEYDPASLDELVGPLLAGDAEAVYGIRGFQSHSAFSFWYVIGNKGVTLAANVLYNRWLTDIMTCHKVMSTDLFRGLRLREEGFGIEPEITARLLRSGRQIYEVPVTYRARRREEGKKLTAADGLRVLLTLLRCRVT
jgi:glycosyltransferase involved in cell wall biosynthesis